MKDSERPLEAARKRIEARKKEAKPPETKNERSRTLEESTTEVDLVMAEITYLSEVYPEPLRKLQGDVARTIQEREKVQLTSKPIFEFDTNSDRRLVELFKMGKSPVKSVSCNFSATIVEKGQTELRITFGHPGIYKEKHDDIESRIFFEITYDERENLVTWIMGDPMGTEIKYKDAAPKNEGQGSYSYKV